MVDEEKTSSDYRQQGLSFALQISGWLVAPLIIALFLGKWLDERYGTDPWLFLLCSAVAFAITMIGLVIQTHKYIKELEKAAKDKNDKKQ